MTLGWELCGSMRGTSIHILNNVGRKDDKDNPNIITIYYVLFIFSLCKEHLRQDSGRLISQEFKQKMKHGGRLMTTQARLTEYAWSAGRERGRARF